MVEMMRSQSRCVQQVMTIGYHTTMTPISGPARVVGLAIGDVRRAIGWTQQELGRRSGFSQSFVSLVENGKLGDLTFDSAGRLLEAMGARLNVGVSAPFMADRSPQRDPAHARCSSYVAQRLRREGWQTAGEVEVGGDRSRGWIDLLAYDPRSRMLLVIEIKTEIADIGAIERTLGWYEREAWAAARRLGWRPRLTLGCLILLSTRANDDRLRRNRATFRTDFPVRARLLQSLVTNGVGVGPGARAMAMVDPRSQRAKWLRATQLDGRSTPAPYVDYADFMRVDSNSQRRRPAA
jgi:transcriptional regulator with XRE-family HTH domain